MNEQQVEQFVKTLDERFFKEQKATLEKVEAMLNQRDYGTQGDILVAVKQMIEKSRKEAHEEIASAFGTLDNKLNSIQGTRQPSKLDKIERYLDLLYGARNSGHKIDTEITEALKMYREEAGI